MARSMLSLLDRLVLDRAQRLWQGLAEASVGLDADGLRRLRSRARRLRQPLDLVIRAADARLALPLIGGENLRKPLGADWLWRPDLWRGPIERPGATDLPARAAISDDATLFHDCPRGEIALRQIRNLRETDLAPFGLRIEVFGFDGGFLSLVLDLPSEAAQGLKPRHILQLNAIIETERPLSLQARVNLRRGAQVQQLSHPLPQDSDETLIEFDLATLTGWEQPVDQIWLDLILDRPAMNQMILRDITLARRPRADF